MFWKNIKKGRNQQKSNCDFYKYFKDLNDVDPKLGKYVEEKIGCWDVNNDLQNVECLDKEISINELEKAIGKLKRNKANGLDNILNEFLIYGGDLLKIVMLKLFNTLLNTTYFPSIWASGEIFLSLKMVTQMFRLITGVSL